ncbi:ABC transporter permease [Amycolatopsis thermoflava]|uniref:Iron(III) transport system permease protein n=1 Tax=Amycolatopsis thermoflava TaxID=84480 RepID=A0A3N2G643_9PSEU|nr:iron ABC transporter permease [Amycolatopsis thermoflava]ROS32108.1 iron(III) transport system permease protein [Amycolatopsis thermoflava]
MTTLTEPDRAAPPRPGPPAPRYRRLLGARRELWVQYAVLALLALLVLAPVVPTLIQSVLDRPLYEAGGLFTPANYVRLFTEAGFGTVVLNTLLFAVLTTVLTLLIAVPMAVLVVRTRLPFGRGFAAAMQWPFFISSLILGFGWITLYGPAGFVSTQVRQWIGTVPWNLYSIPGMAITEAVALAPIAYVFCANALGKADASLESAAQVCGAKPLRILFSVVIPMLRPPMVYSSILVFSMSVETLSVPLLYGQPVGIKVFSTFLYTNGLQSINPDYGVLGAASVLILLVTVGLVAVQAKLLKEAQRFVSVRGKATRPRRLELGWIKWIGVAAITVYVVFGALLPIGGLVFRSFTRVFTPLQNPFQTATTANYERVFGFAAYVQSIVNSLIVAAVGAVVVSFVATLAVLVSKRSTFRFRRLAEYLALAPQAIPGIIIGIGLFWAFAYLPFGMGGLVQGTLAALVVGFGLRALPSGFGSIAPSVMQIGQELDNAARVSGADWVRTFTRVLGRLLTPAFAGAMILTFVTMLKEYSPAVFLASADSNVIGTTMLELWVQGNTGSVAALATVQIVITAVFVGLARLLMKGHRDA